MWSKAGSVRASGASVTMVKPLALREKPVNTLASGWKAHTFKKKENKMCSIPQGHKFVYIYMHGTVCKWCGRRKS